MWGLCLECGISSGCSCDAPPKGRIKYQPVDHKKEQEKWLANLKAEIEYDTNYFYNINNQS